MNRFIDQIWTFSGRLVVADHILQVIVHGCMGDVLPDDLQRTLDDVMAAGLFAQVPLASGCGLQAALSTSGEGTAGLTQDDGAGDVHLWGGRWEAFSSEDILWKCSYFHVELNNLHFITRHRHTDSVFKPSLRFPSNQEQR